MTDLTPREIEIRALLCKGWTNKEIGQALKISHRTVEDHRINIFKKTGVNNIVQLVRKFYGIEDEETVA